MQVKHRLAGAFAAVGDYPEGVSDAGFPGSSLYAQKQLAQKRLVLLRGLSQRWDVELRDHQEVHRCPWGNVVKGHEVIVLEKHTGRCLMVGNAAKNTLTHQKKFYLVISITHKVARDLPKVVLHCLRSVVWRGKERRPR